MSKLNKLFFIKEYPGSCFYAYSMDFRIKIIRIFKLKKMYIVHIGYSIDLFADKESIDFIREKKKEYIEAKNIFLNNGKRACS